MDIAEFQILYKIIPTRLNKSQFETNDFFIIKLYKKLRKIIRNVSSIVNLFFLSSYLVSVVILISSQTGLISFVSVLYNNSENKDDDFKQTKSPLNNPLGFFVYTHLKIPFLKY